MKTNTRKFYVWQTLLATLISIAIGYYIAFEVMADSPLLFGRIAIMLVCAIPAILCWEEIGAWASATRKRF